MMTVDQRDLSTDLTALVANLLQFHGPVTIEYFCDLYRLEVNAVRQEVDRLITDQRVIAGALFTGDDAIYVSDAGNFEALLRIGRLNRRTQDEPKDLDALPSFLFSWQTRNNKPTEILDVLRGYGAPVESWESDLLPARIPGYRAHHLDSLFNEEELLFVDSRWGFDDPLWSVDWKTGVKPRF